MTVRHIFAATLVFVSASPAPAAPPTDVASLFPPGTLAYAELHNPAELGPQLAATLKGTPLEDATAFVEGKRAAAKTFQELNAKRELADLALALSPEMLAEFRRLGGVAVGLTGFNDRGEPELAVAVLTGDSAAAGLAARAFVTAGDGMRKVAEVSKVAVFQYRPPAVTYDPTGMPKLANDKPPTEGPREPTFAYTPGLFVVGTSRAAIAPAIKRFLGEETDGLAGAAGFKSAAAEHRKSGLFFYVNYPELAARSNAAARGRGEPFDLDSLAPLALAVNAKALKAVAGNVQFRDGGVVLTAGLTLDPTIKSPLAELLAGPPASIDALHHARRPAAFAATVNLPEKARAAALVGFLDALAKSTGELGRLPSEAVKELETKYKLPLTDGLLAKIRAVTVIAPAKQELPKGAVAAPMFVAHLDDATAATEWEEFLPKLIADIGRQASPAAPASETIGGVKVLSLPATGLPWKAGVHYARKGAVLVIGLDRKLVAAAVTADAATSAAGGDKPLSPPAGEIALLGALNFGDLIGLLTPGTEGATPPLPARGRGRENPAQAGEMQKEADKARAAFGTALAAWPAAAVSVRRAGDELRFEVAQPNARGSALTPVITTGADWFDKVMMLRDPNNGGYDNDGPRRRRWGW